VKNYVRRAQRMGRFTISVTLPKEWIKSTGIGPGDLVSMYVREDGLLVVGPGPASGSSSGVGRIVKTVHADMCSGPGLLGRVLVALYISGVDEITFVGEPELRDEQVREIRRAAAALNGASVVEESRKRVTVHVLVDPASSQVSKILSRMHELTVEALNGALSALHDGDLDQLRKAMDAGREIDRNYWLAARQLLLAANRPELMRSIGMEGMRQIPGFRTVAKALDDAGTAAAAAAGDLLPMIDDRDGQVAAELATHTEAVLNLYRRSFDGWSTVNTAAANQAVEEAAGVRQRLREAAVVLAGGSTGAAAVSYLYDLAQVAASSGTVAEMAINRSVIESSDSSCVRDGERGHG